MKHLPVAVLIGGLVLLTLFALDRSCTSGRELAQAKADYEAQVRILEADNALKQDALLKAEETITQQQFAIGEAQALASAKDAKITLLSAQLAEIVGQEPPTTPDIEALPIVINLRAQVSRLTEMFSLSEAKGADKDRIITSQATIITAKDEQIAALRGIIDNEHTLRVQAEGLFWLSEHARKTNIWKTIGYCAGAAALGYVIGK